MIASHSNYLIQESIIKNRTKRAYERLGNASHETLERYYNIHFKNKNLLKDLSQGHVLKKMILESKLKDK